MSTGFQRIPFVFATHFYREPSPPLDELRRDMHTVKRLGFNTLKIQESWCIDEPRPGDLRLEKIEAILSQARQLELGIYFGVTLEQAPAWLWRRFPDCRLVYGTGEPHEDPTQYVLPADGKPGPCWHHRGARRAARRFIARLAERLGRFDNIIAWNVWQEVGFWPMRAGLGGFCYCRNTRRRFRRWLRRRYGDLDTLNRTWRTGFGTWKEVEPPRVYAMVPATIDWRTFMDDVYLPWVVRWKRRAFQMHDPLARPVFCHVGSAIIGSGLEWRLARQVDFFGTSSYPAWNPFGPWDAGKPAPGQSIPLPVGRRQEMWASSVKYDYTRSATGRGRHFWAAEFQGGPVVTGLFKGPDPSPDDIRQWLLTVLAAGATGLSFWNHRLELFWAEAHGFGLCDGRGQVTDRAAEAGRVGRAIQPHADLFQPGTLAPAEVAILVNEDLYHFACATPEAQAHLAHTIRGLYKHLWFAGVAVDFVDSTEVAQGRLAPYKAVLLPLPLAISEELMGQLATYVEAGGTLLSEACPGRYDPYGMANPGGLSPTAERLFGVEHEALWLCQEWDGQTRWTPAERRHGEILGPTEFIGIGPMSGLRVRASLYVQTLRPITATPILAHGPRTAGVLRTVGRGRACLVGTFLGHSGASDNHAPTGQFLLRVVTEAGVQPDRCGRLLRRRRLAVSGEAWFLFNPDEEPATETLDTTGFAEVKDLLDEPLTMEGAERVRITVPPVSVRCVVLRRQARA